MSKIGKISIGMPVFNGGMHIEAALISLLNQSYGNIELIISDNASTDQTETICRKYSEIDHRITYIKQVSNKGGLANFFTVLSHASGEYFMWAAADDVWDSKWVETLLAVCIKKKCIAFGMVRQIDSHGKHIPYLTNDNNLSFSGFRCIRRIKFFFNPGTFGKANLIYAIFPRELLSPQALEVLVLKFVHVDMLFVYNLLKYVEVSAGYDTFLYKRIHDYPLLNGNNRTLAKIFLADISNPIKNFFQYYKGYFSLSSCYEKVLLIAFYIPAIIYDILARLTSKYFVFGKNNR